MAKFTPGNVAHAADPSLLSEEETASVSEIGSNFLTELSHGAQFIFPFIKKSPIISEVLTSLEGSEEHPGYYEILSDRIIEEGIKFLMKTDEAVLNILVNIFDEYDFQDVLATVDEIKNQFKSE